MLRTTIFFRGVLRTKGTYLGYAIDQQIQEIRQILRNQEKNMSSAWSISCLMSRLVVEEFFDFSNSLPLRARSKQFRSSTRSHTIRISRAGSSPREAGLARSARKVSLTGEENSCRTCAKVHPREKWEVQVQVLHALAKVESRSSRWRRMHGLSIGLVRQFFTSEQVRGQSNSISKLQRKTLIVEAGVGKAPVRALLVAVEVDNCFRHSSPETWEGKLKEKEHVAPHQKLALGVSAASSCDNEEAINLIHEGEEGVEDEPQMVQHDIEDDEC